MSGLTSREVVLSSTPQGIPGPAEMTIREAVIAEPEEGQVVVRSELWSVDPYQRVLMNPQLSSNLARINPGDVLGGGGLGRVLVSRSPDFQEGDLVVHRAGWREVVVVEAGALLRLGDLMSHPTAGLGVGGLPGFAAWIGMTQKIRPGAGDTIFVSSAAGAVGSLAGQLAARAGARVVGSAGSTEKVDWLKSLGFDDAFDYRTETPEQGVARVAPEGIDAYFDNVGGGHLDAALGAMNDFGRIAMCGALGAYNGESGAISNASYVFTRSLTMYGFRQMDHLARFPEFRAEISPLIESGEIASAEHVLDGIDAALLAFQVMYAERPLGKLLIRL